MNNINDRKNELENFNLFAEVFIHYIKEDDNFKKEFIKFVPNLEADIISASINDNCSCKGRIREYIGENKKECLDFILNYESNNNVSFDLKIVKVKNTYTNFSGRVARTKLEEWGGFALAVKEQNAVYSNFSIVKEGDDILVFFL
jgi:hypothetical protein